MTSSAKDYNITLVQAVESIEPESQTRCPAAPLHARSRSCPFRGAYRIHLKFPVRVFRGDAVPWRSGQVLFRAHCIVSPFIPYPGGSPPGVARAFCSAHTVLRSARRSPLRGSQGSARHHRVYTLFDGAENSRTGPVQRQLASGTLLRQRAIYEGRFSMSAQICTHSGDLLRQRPEGYESKRPPQISNLRARGGNTRRFP